jgi:biopolymer transport protein ExbD
MASDLGSSGKNGVNVDLNIVPFIDLMSCLTAFLLVTAVWVGTAQLETHPQARHGEPGCPDDTCDDPKLSVLVTKDQFHVGISRLNEVETIARSHTDDDWKKLAAKLRSMKSSVYFLHKVDIEIAAETTPQQRVTYQTLVTAMDVAVQSGFERVAVMDAQSLSTRPL